MLEWLLTGDNLFIFGALGEEMRSMHEYITNTAKGELTASKGNSEETKKIHLDKT